MLVSWNRNKCLCLVSYWVLKGFFSVPKRESHASSETIDSSPCTLLSKLLGLLKDFPSFKKKKYPRAPATSAITYFEHRVKSWHFILGFGATQTLLWWQPAWRREGVKRPSRRTRQTHLPPKLNNANYAEGPPCQQGSLPPPRQKQHRPSQHEWTCLKHKVLVCDTESHIRMSFKAPFLGTILIDLCVVFEVAYLWHLPRKQESKCRSDSLPCYIKAL